MHTLEEYKRLFRTWRSDHLGEDASRSFEVSWQGEATVVELSDGDWLLALVQYMESEPISKHTVDDLRKRPDELVHEVIPAKQLPRLIDAFYQNAVITMTHEAMNHPTTQAKHEIATAGLPKEARKSQTEKKKSKNKHREVRIDPGGPEFVTSSRSRDDSEVIIPTIGPYTGAVKKEIPKTKPQAYNQKAKPVKQRPSGTGNSFDDLTTSEKIQYAFLYAKEYTLPIQRALAHQA